MIFVQMVSDFQCQSWMSMIIETLVEYRVDIRVLEMHTSHLKISNKKTHFKVWWSFIREFEGKLFQQETLNITLNILYFNAHI